MHHSGLNRRQRREAVRLLLEMRSVYPGDPHDAMYRDARRLDPRLPDRRRVRVFDASVLSPRDRP